MGAELGRGGMGVVRVADDRSLLRQVAVKELLSSDPQARQDFIEEARTTAALEHPNIVPVHELGSRPDGRVFLAMKRIRGRTLDELFHARTVERDVPHTPDSVRRLLSVFDKVCDALAFAHQQGVVHRDLKPANVMVGDFGEVLVMDWGIALIHDDSPLARTVSGEATEDRSGEVVGTPAFMAPEQANGRVEEIDARTDIFALGALLAFLLTGRPPYSGRTTVEVVANAARHRLTAPHRQAPKRAIPAALSAIALKAMAAHLRDRYATVADLQADVHAWQDLRPVSAWRPSLPQRFARWVRRRPTTTASVFLCLTFGLAIATLAAAMQGQIWQEQALREAEARRSADLARDAAEQRERAAAAAEEARRANIEALLRADRIEELRKELGVQVAVGRDVALREFEARVRAEGRGALGIGSFGTTIPPADVDRYLAAYNRLFKAHGQHGTPVTADDYTNRAWLLGLRGRLGEADADLRSALALDPANRDALAARASICCQTGDYDTGLAIVRKQLDGLPIDNAERAIWLYYRAQIQVFRQQMESARVDLDEALRLDPQLHLALMLRASVLAGAGQLNDALADLDRALELVPGEPNVLTNRAMIRRATGDLDGAFEDVRNGLRAAPENAALWATSGELRRARGDNIGALADTERAIELAPDNWIGWYHRANVLATMGRRDDARTSYSRAHSLANSDLERNAVNQARRRLLGD